MLTDNQAQVKIAAIISRPKRRHRYQSGNVFIKGNFWYGRYWADVIEGGATIRKQLYENLGLKTMSKSQAKHKLAKILEPINERRHEAVVIDIGRTFEAQAETWIASLEGKSKPSTIAGYRSILDKHVLPVVGALPLTDVNNGALKQLIEPMRDKAATTIKNITMVVKQVVASATDYDGRILCPREWNNEFIGIPTASRNKMRRPCPTAVQVDAMIAQSNGWLRVMLALAAASGLRAGELLGLRIEDVTDSGIRVSQCAWQGRIVAPKTENAIRDIELHSDIMRMLRTFIGKRSSGLIFCTETGRPMSLSNIENRKLSSLQAAIGMERMGLHSLRRFRNTYLRNRTSTPDGLIKLWMGHADSSMTDVYDRIADDAALRLERAELAGYGFTLPSESSDAIEYQPATVRA